MSSGRRRTTDRHYSAEDQALDQISKEAEERIQARRLARAEAREIRLREIERQQKEEEEKQRSQSQGSDAKSASSYSGSRRGSNESTESDVSSKDSRDPKDQVRQFKTQLRELEEKYKAAMVTNAQLDNTKTSQVFQLELLKEQLEEQEEGMIEVQREYKDKCRDYDLLKRDHENLKLEFEGIKQQIELKDKLLKESGLVIVTTDEGEFSLTKCSNMSEVPIPELGSSIISEEAAELLKKAGEGTLGNSEVKVESVDKKTENIESVVDDKVDRDEGSTLVDVEGEVSRKVSGSEDINVVECLEEIPSKNTGDVEDVNNNAETDENQINYKNTRIKENVNPIITIHNSETIIEKDDERSDKGDGRGSVSDEDEVFYESKSEVSLTECVDVSDIGKQKEGSEIADLKSSGEDDVEERKSESDEKGSAVAEGNMLGENEDVAGAFSESESIEVILNVVVEGNEDKEVGDKEGKVSEFDTLEVKRKFGSGSSFKKIVYSESGISLESDVTYHSETDDEILEEACEKPVVDDTNIEKIDAEFGDEQVLMRENVAGNSKVEFHLDNEVVGATGRNSSLGNDTDSETKIEDKAVVTNTEGSQLPGNRDNVTKVDIEVSEPQAESAPYLPQNDEVFMSLPLGKMGEEKDMIEFAKNYVTDIVLKSVDLYNKEVKEEKILVRQQSYTEAKIAISIPKRHYSEELVETASAVIPRKLSSGGSVEILSPVVHVPSENSGDLKFFSYKVDTDADVVLTSIEEEKNPLEGMVSMDCMQSPVSGFGICYSGVKGHSDIDSDSDSSDEGPEEGEMESGIDFISMPIATDKGNDDSKDIQQNKIEVDDGKIINEDENKEVSSDVNVPGDKSDEVVDSSADRSNTESDSTQSKNEGQFKDDSVNDLKERDTEQVDKTDDSGDNLNKFYKGIESEVREMGKSEVEVVSGKDIDLEEKVSSKMGDDENVACEEEATGGDVDKEPKSEPVDNSPDSGSLLSGEISPNEESGHSIDSNSGKSKKKGSKKSGSKKHSKEECLIS